MTKRSPIVAVMGHVDHGKTTLLDALRNQNVAEGEAGGITQNTRAHQVSTPSGGTITFLDTPGHEAFSSMRRRGAQSTDIVLLVVAADDGLQPQTIESIKFAEQTNTPLIVAINKVDLPIKSLDKLKGELSAHNVLIEEYGGNVMLFQISALKKTGLTELLEGIELFAETLELQAEKPTQPEYKAEAYVLESQIDSKQGAVALCILKSGELNGREFGVSAEGYFRVRSYLNEFQQPVKSVKLSDPIWITGLKESLAAGTILGFVEDEKVARSFERKLAEIVEKKDQPATETTAHDLLAQMLSRKNEVKQGVEQKVLPLIIKTSTRGTLEAVKHELEKLNNDERKVQFLVAEVGDVTESEIQRIQLAKGIILTFQLPTPRKILEIAKRERVLVRNYEVIYEMLDEVEVALDGLVEPTEIEHEVARAKIKQLFTLTNGNLIAGSEVTSGTINRGYAAWIERDGEEIARGKITQLRHLKDEVKEVRKGSECGILLEPKPEVELQPGDIVVTYRVEKQ